MAKRGRPKKWEAKMRLQSLKELIIDIPFHEKQAIYQESRQQGFANVSDYILYLFKVDQAKKQD